jgi:alkanesulfonate monooxygenase SsuD/methylene tetrahydromethanopterin reductase-like flavin-dependent oxidoreductase (luciferase family)
MRAGPLMLIRNHPEKRRPLVEIYAEALEDCVLAEELGLDFCLLGEHHFSVDEWAPSPMTLLAAMAARTERIRLGTGVLQFPLYDPVRMAEDIAAVDLISNGRMELGVGIGSIPREYEVFGIDPETRSGRLFEALTVLERCFSETEPFDHEGRHFHYRGVHMTTKPVQNPMPIWFGGAGKQNIARAAKRGYNLSAYTPRWEPALRAAGRDPKDYRVAVPQFMHLAEDRDQAWDEAQDGLHWLCSFYRQAGVKGFRGSTAEGYLEHLPPPEEFRNLPGFGLIRGAPFLVGTPDEVLDMLRPVLDGVYGRVTDLPITFRHAGMPSEPVHRSMRLFASELLPTLRAANPVAAEPCPG